MKEGYVLVLFLECPSFQVIFSRFNRFCLFSEAVASTMSIAVIDGMIRNVSAFELHNM